MSHEPRQSGSLQPRPADASTGASGHVWLLADEIVAGCISCFEAEGRTCVGYWVGTSFRGQGIAMQALQLLLQEVPQRPLSAFVAAHNVGSIRVLEKCRFIPDGGRHSPASDRYRECEELIFVRN
ncbi:MAG: GNAT family N-acetyltransferase [Planctomycetaceae bacterium]|nr:GNAT family N-acetyltransferase [Planctomycetaceae bacterium]